MLQLSISNVVPVPGPDLHEHVMGPSEVALLQWAENFSHEISHWTGPPDEPALPPPAHAPVPSGTMHSSRAACWALHAGLST
jgi:hypothetical protein